MYDVFREEISKAVVQKPVDLDFFREPQDGLLTEFLHDALLMELERGLEKSSDKSFTRTAQLVAILALYVRVSTIGILSRSGLQRVAGSLKMQVAREEPSEREKIDIFRFQKELLQFTLSFLPPLPKVD